MIMEGIPVILEMLMPNVNENSKNIDTDNYPFVAGTSAALANKTIRVSSIEVFTGAGAGTQVLQYIKFDDNWVITTPLTTGFQQQPDGTDQNWYRFTIKELFGCDYIAIRQTVKTKLSADAAHTAYAKIYGIAIDERVE